MSAFLLSSPGCYYAHLAKGQLKLMWARRSVEDVLADPATPPSVQADLHLVGRAREFAGELGLEVGEQYTSYVEWPGDRIVTTLVATRPGEIEPAGFRFPIVGRVPYKGFFSQERAETDAARLRAEGLDVCVLAVPAYSTLGWMADPVTSPMLSPDRSRLFETIVHELVHATVFVAGLPDFNEGVASFIGEQATLRYFEENQPHEAPRVRARLTDDRLLAEALLWLREEVAALYAEEAPESRNSQRQPSAARRSALSDEARVRVAGLAFRERDGATLAGRLRLNDACLAIRGTYARDAVRHEALLQALDGDLNRFVARLIEADGRDEPDRWFFEPIESGETQPPADR